VREAFGRGGKSLPCKPLGGSFAAMTICLGPVLKMAPTRAAFVASRRKGPASRQSIGHASRAGASSRRGRSDVGARLAI